MRIVVVALVLLAAAAGCGSSDTQSAPPEQTTTAVSEPTPDPSREAAPPLSGTSLDGDPIVLTDFRGRPVLINVWSSW